MQKAVLMPSNGTANGFFGQNVDIDSDYAIVAAGKYINSNGAEMVYIFKRDGVAWVERARLTIDTAPSIWVPSVALEADQAVVGVRDDDNENGLNAGAVYVFDQEVGTDKWGQCTGDLSAGYDCTKTEKLIAENGTAGDGFGADVDLTAGYLVVGASGADGNVSETGAAYVLVPEGNSWREQAKLIAGDGVTNDQLGETVAVAGDDAIVGASWYDSASGDNAGAAYAFNLAVDVEDQILGQGNEAIVTEVYTQIEPNFAATPRVGLGSLTVTLTNMSRPTEFISDYLWDYGDGITSTVSTVTHTHTYAQPGVYTITLTASGLRGSNTLTQAAYVEVLAADFTIEPDIGLAPLPITFTNSISGPVDNMVWDFGDGITQTATTLSASHTYSQPGVYSPKLILMRGQHTFTVTKENEIAVLGAEFSASPQTGLPPLNVTFTDIVSTPVTYRAWDFGDGSSPVVVTDSRTIGYTYTQAGVYTPSLTISRNGYTFTQGIPGMIAVAHEACVITTTQTTWWDSAFFYRQPLTLTVGSPLAYTPGVTQVVSVTLDTESLIAAGEMQASGQDVRIVYREADGWRELPHHLEGLNGVTTTITFPIRADINSTDHDYYLYYGHAAASAPTELYPAFEAPAETTISGSGTFTPTVAFTADSDTGLAPFTVAFTNLTTSTTGIVSYSWDFGDGGSSTAVEPSHTYHTPGVYTVTLTAETSEGLTVTRTWPWLIQVPGVDRSGEVTTTLGQVETPVASATICADVTTPQTFTSADGRLRFTFPPGAVTADTVVTHTPQPIAWHEHHLLAKYDLAAVTVADQSPLPRFEEAVSVQLHYDNDRMPEWVEGSVTAFIWNNSTNGWDVTPTSVDSGQNLAHFNSDQVGPQSISAAGLANSGGSSAEEGPLPGAVNAALPDLFTGAATWAYPLHVPPGRRGLQPDLTISYNSHLVGTPQTDHQEAGWLGAGFVLEPPFIEIAYDPLDFNMSIETAQGKLRLPDEIEAYLRMNGGRTRLVRSSDWFADADDSLVATFRLAQDNFWRIELRQDSAMVSGDSTTALSLALNGQEVVLENLYWQITAQDGTTYRFGFYSDSVEVALQRLLFIDNLGEMKWVSYPGRAYLDTITDVYGNEVRFSYDNDSFETAVAYGMGGQQKTAKFNRFVRVREIFYTDDSRRVTFDYEQARADDEDAILYSDRSYRLYPELLSGVEMWAEGENFLRYEFDYQENSQHDVFLHQIKVCGEPDGGTYTLCQDTDYRRFDDETTTFGYHTTAGGLSRIKEITNGYGGTLAFDYDDQGRVTLQEIDGGNATPIIRSFSYRGGITQIWQGSANQGADGQAEVMTQYVFHNASNGLINPFGTPDAITGQIRRISVYDPNEFGLPHQATCYDYDLDTIKLQESQQGYVFIAPESVKTVYDQDCTGQGQMILYDYDAVGNLQELSQLGDPATDDDDRTTEIEYTASERVTNRPKTVGVYDHAGQPVAETLYNYQTDSADAVTRVTITQFGNIVPGFDSPDQIHQIDFDAYGNVKETIQGSGAEARHTQISYDSRFVFPEKTIYPLDGLEEQYGYDARFGLPTMVTDINEFVTTYGYDGLGRVKDGFGVNGAVSYGYVAGSSGLEVTRTYAGGIGGADDYQTTEVYNGLGQLIRTTVPGNASTDLVTEYQYDKLGRLMTTSVPDGQSGTPGGETLLTTYDALGRPKTAEALDGNTTSYDYSGWDEVTVTISGNGLTDQVKSYTLDAFGQVREIEEAGTTTKYAYNPLGLLTNITDANNNLTTITYDSLGQKRAMTDPDMGTWSYTYNSYGELESQMDARGVEITFDYDDLGRLTRKDYDTSNAPEVGLSAPVVYTYTTNQREMSDGSGQTVWAYDSAGRLVQETKSINGGGSFTTGYGYDALGQLETVTYPDGEQVSQQYNRAGQVTNVTGQNIYLLSAQYTAVGQLSSRNLRVNIGQNLSYQPDTLRLGTESVTMDGTTLRDVGVTFDSLGRLATYTEAELGVNLTNDYDPLNRLETVTGSTHGQSYSYDPVGNLLDRDGLTFSYTGRPHLPTESPGVATYDYDLSGNLVSQELLTHTLVYTYDAENRLVAVTNGLSTTTFLYDGDGELVKRVAQDGATRYYVNEFYETGHPARIATGVSRGGVDNIYSYPDAESVGGKLYTAWFKDVGLLASLEYGTKVTDTWQAQSVGFNPTRSDQLSVAATSGGALNVVWLEEKAGDQSKERVYHSRLDAGQNSWSPAQVMSPPSTNAGQRSWQPAMESRGLDIHLVWVENTPNHQALSRVYHRLSTDGGVSWSGTNEVNGTIGAYYGQPDIGVVNGQAVAVWNALGLPTPNGSGNLYYNYQENGVWQLGQALGGEFGAWPRLGSNGSTMVVMWKTADGRLKYRSWLGNGWGVVQTVPSTEGVATSGDIRRHDVAVNSEGDVIVAWVNQGGDLVLTRREGGSWGEPEMWFRGWGGNHLNLVFDDEGNPQVIQRKGSDLYHITRPGNVGTVKRYYAGGEQIGLRVNGDLYYTPSDPVGQSQLLLDAAGQEVGHLLYDAFGSVLESNLTPELASVLTGPGVPSDPDAGLVHVGGGQWYDPALGRPLQLDLSSGVLGIPQSLNRASVMRAISLQNEGPGQSSSLAIDIGKSLISNGIGAGLGDKLETVPGRLVGSGGEWWQVFSITRGKYIPATQQRPFVGDLFRGRHIVLSASDAQNYTTVNILRLRPPENLEQLRRTLSRRGVTVTSRPLFSGRIWNAGLGPYLTVRGLSAGVGADIIVGGIWQGVEDHLAYNLWVNDPGLAFRRVGAAAGTNATNGVIGTVATGIVLAPFVAVGATPPGWVAVGLAIGLTVTVDVSPIGEAVNDWWFGALNANID